MKKLQQEAPLTSIKACLEKTKEFIDNDEKNVPRSWYFETIKEFNKYKEIIAPEEAEKIQKELDEIKSKLNLK